MLAAWCGGLGIGAVLLGPAATAPALCAAFITGGIAILSVALMRPGRRGVTCLLAPALMLCGLGRGGASVHLPGVATADYYYGRHVSLVGTVVRSSSSPTFQSFWLTGLRMSGRPLAGTVQVTSRSPVAVVPGSTLRVTGTMERLPGRAYDGSTGFDDRMQRQGVLAAIPSAAFQALAPPPTFSLLAMAWRLRTAISAGLRGRAPEPEATVLLGELVGIRGKLPAAVEADLVDSGLVHLLALSGLKVAIVAGILVSLLRRAGRRTALLAITGIFAYALVGGASSAALRSALMGSLGLLAQVLRRDTDPPRSLLVAASAMLGLDPQLVSDLSFQYSFLGVAGIQALQPAVDARLWVLPHPFREALSVSLAAQLAPLPLTAAYFHAIPVAGPLVNTVAVPFLGSTMAAAAWVATGLPGAGGTALFLAAGSAHALLALAHLASAAPAGVIRVPWFGLPHALAYYCGAGIMVLASRLRAHPGRVLPAAVSAAILVALARSLPDGRLPLVFLDTPGGGVLLTAPDGARMLVDSGASPSGLASALDSELGPPVTTLDAVLLTGSNAAAAGGIGGLGERVPGLLLVPAGTPGDVPGLVADAFAGHGSTVRWLVPGEELRWHGLDLVMDACGPGLAVSVGFGNNTAWICDSGTRPDPGAVPAGALSVLDVGDGKVEPEGGMDRASWVVEHGSRGASGSLSAATLGPRLWRTARDGPLALSCDAWACRR